MDQKYDYIVKLMLIGNSNVGKTAFMHRFCDNTYKPNLPATVGLQYRQKVHLTSGKKVLVQLWDTAGQERFRNITPSYYRSAMGIILCYSVQDRQSFKSVTIWVKQIKKYCPEDMPIIIVGCKCDLIRRQVPQKDGKAMAELNSADFMEASAKDDINIKEVINRLIEKIKPKLPEKMQSIRIGQERNPDRICSC